MKIIRIFYLKIFLFLVVKLSIYLNRRVFVMLTLILPFATIVALAGSASSKARHTYNIPHATIQSKCSHTGVNLLSYKHATFH